ncbi:hypothetical protein EGW74_16395, partial [Enterococcus casseliflavus]|uniref:hypothetical protein n=1 Tax=Enterococcus casseliflavus TaxID=37734 RepID=UPI000FC1162E
VGKWHMDGNKNTIMFIFLPCDVCVHRDSITRIPIILLFADLFTTTLVLLSGKFRKTVLKKTSHRHYPLV